MVCYLSQLKPTQPTSMPTTRLSNPHLRLTAAILVAVLAALAGTLDGENSARGRRGDTQTLIGGIRLVSLPDNDLTSAHRAVGLCVVADHRLAVDSQANDRTSTAAPARAAERIRLDSSRAEGAAFLRTTALPPPIAC